MRVIALDPEYDRLDAVRRLQFAPDGRGFAAVVGAKELTIAVSVWDLAADRPAARTFVDCSSDRDWYAEPAVAPDLGRVAYHAHQDTASTDYLVVETAGGGATAEVGGDDEGYAVHCLAFTPHGGTLLAGVSGVDGPRVARWDVADLLGGGLQAATTARQEPIDLPGDPDALACSPDGAALAVGLADGWVLLVESASGGTVRRLRAKPARRRRVASPRRLAFDPDGRRLAVRANGTVTVWDAAPGGTGKPLAELAGPKPLTDAGWSPDGRLLATACADGSVAFWEAAGFAPAARFDWGVGPLFAVAFAPDGTTCAAGAGGGRVVQWDVDG